MWKLKQMVKLMALCSLMAACVPTSGSDAAPLAPAAPAQTGRMIPADPPAPPGQRARSPAFDQAQAARNSSALILFLIHHREDPALASVRDVLAHRRLPDSRATVLATAGPEAEVVAAFDAARLAGTAAARQDFLARYPDHVLASEIWGFIPD